MEELTALQKIEKENPELVNKKYIELLKEEIIHLESENSELKAKFQELESQIEKMKHCDNCGVRGCMNVGILCGRWEIFDV